MADAVPDSNLMSMAPTVIERASELREFVGSLARLRDTAGVLSVTIGIEPGVASGRTPGWEIALQNDLAQLRKDNSVGRIFDRRVEEVSPRLEELLDPTTSGRGRALYMALESGAVSEAILQSELPTGACLGPVAHVLPLLAALADGEPAGLLAASRDSISVSERELGRVRHVDRIELEPWVGDWWPEMKGPARANPQRGQEVVSQRDRYERRVAAAYRHTLDEAAVAIRALARERDWTRAVLAGDPRRIDVLDAVLLEHGLATTTIEANLEGLRTEDALERLETALETLFRKQALEGARLAVNGASAGGKGACGLVAVLTALSEGRAAHLLIDADRTFPGVVGPGESLAAAEDAEGGIDCTDLIVARALTTGAAVTPLRGEIAEALAACDGIAALLRW